MANNHLIEMDFRVWFMHGSGHKPGYLDIINRWLFFAMLIAWLLSRFVNKPIDAVGGTVLLPLAAVLVGIVFAWSGAAQSLLQSDEMLTVAANHPGGLSDWVFGIQLAVGVVISACLAWGLACLGLFGLFFKYHHPDMYHVAVWLLYTLTIVGIRECWGLITFSQVMVLSRAALQISKRLQRKHRKKVLRSGRLQNGGLQESTREIPLMAKYTDEEQRKAIEKLQAGQREDVTPEERERFLAGILSVPRKELEETPEPKEKRGRRRASPSSPGVSA